MIDHGNENLVEAVPDGFEDSGEGREENDSFLDRTRYSLERSLLNHIYNFKKLNELFAFTTFVEVSKCDFSSFTAFVKIVTYNELSHCINMLALLGQLFTLCNMHLILVRSFLFK